MRQRLVGGLFVLAFGLAGAAAGQGNATGPVLDEPRCELILEGASPQQRLTDGDEPPQGTPGEEPPLVVTQEPSGLVKGYVDSPAAFLVARQQCANANPADVIWQSWQGDQSLNGAQFRDSAATKLYVYDDDPLGLQTWKGPPGSQGITYEELQVDIRFGTEIEKLLATPMDDGSVELAYLALKYSPDAGAMAPYAGAGVTVEKRCGDGAWTELAKTKTTREGDFGFGVSRTECADLQLRATLDDTPDTWGLPTILTL